MDQKGIALLFSLLIIGVVMSLSVGVFNIILGELRIGEGARESILAFFAADSGAECALYWDIKKDAFRQEKAVRCAGIAVTVSKTVETIDGRAANVYQTANPLSLANESCVSFRVIKFGDGASRIEALGENVCDAGSKRIVQRGVRVNY